MNVVRYLLLGYLGWVDGLLLHHATPSLRGLRGAPALRSIEQTLVAMARGPGDLLKQVKADVMSTISSELKPQILAEHGELQHQVSNFSHLFARCEGQRSQGLQQSYEKQQGIPVLIANHKACRVQESHLQQQLAACRADLASSRRLATASCPPPAPPGADCAARGEDAEEWLRRVLGDFQKRLQVIREQKMLCANATEAIKLQEAVCHGAAEELSTQRSACEARQHGLDEAACGLAETMRKTCGRYEQCRAQATLSYDLARHALEERLRNLREEWTALQRIECLLGGQGIQHCEEASYSSEALALQAVGLPPCEACGQLAEVPGTAEYNATVFQGIPEDVSLATCAAECCYRQA